MCNCARRGDKRETIETAKQKTRLFSFKKTGFNEIARFINLKNAFERERAFDLRRVFYVL